MSNSLPEVKPLASADHPTSGNGRGVARLGFVRNIGRMTSWTPPAPVNLVDLGFMDSRSKLIDLAAFLDRVQRAGQEDDFRVRELKRAMALLSTDVPVRAREVLLSFSDPTTAAIPKALTQGAVGAYAG